MVKAIQKEDNRGIVGVGIEGKTNWMDVYYITESFNGSWQLIKHIR